MAILQKYNAILEKLMPISTPLSVLIGVLFGSWLHPFAFLSPWIFAFMTFTGSLGSNFSELGKVVKQPLPMLVNLLILHVLMPLIAWTAGTLLYPDDIHTITGYVLAAAIPTGITSFIWVSIYKGDIPLTLSIILIDTLLSPLIVPFSLHWLVGAEANIDAASIMNGLLFMIVIPSVLGMGLNQLTRGKVKTVLGPRLSPFSKTGLSLVVMINASVVSPYLRQIDSKLIGMAVAVFCIAVLGYWLGWALSKLFRWKREVVVTLTYNCGMRNISAGAVLAIAYFPPPVAVPVVLGMLFQQVLASVFGLFLRTVERDKTDQAISLTGESVSK
ncbi:bile acid:sodium symporter family protein [Brevibacillus fulvus]|uniref:Na+-dependent transporter n=1 Tax=Brevibacillus fulvus TaxID=1125967 RepID=A0A938Y0Q7_9BACL|nr:bile acid:sodium symporter family protein [Brevibacillus fulvus]MBM7589896.1 putative Na+-dependent transporter [Brevibacillus fulvus]